MSGKVTITCRLLLKNGSRTRTVTSIASFGERSYWLDGGVACSS